MATRPNSIDELIDEHARLFTVIRRFDGENRELPCLRACTVCQVDTRTSCDSIQSNFIELLINELQEHFTTEERFMRSAQVTGDLELAFDRHADAHATLTKQISLSLLATTPVEQRALILSLIEEWLGKHIGVHDKILIDWLQETQA